MIGLDTSKRHAHSPQATLARRFRWTLTPILLAALTACGGGEGLDPRVAAQDAAPAPDAQDDGDRATIQAKAPAKFRHPGIFMSQARLDTFKASANSRPEAASRRVMPWSSPTRAATTRMRIRP